MNTVHHSSETNEHISPVDAVQAARNMMGGIDLDPASSAIANRKVVKATKYYNQKHNGFKRAWHGRVWLNPPGGMCDKDGRQVIIARAATKTKPARPGCIETGECGLPPGHKHPGLTSSAKAWWFKLVHEYAIGNVKSAVFVAFNMELQQSTQLECFNSSSPAGKPYPSVLKFPHCIPSTRMQFLTYDEEEKRLVPGTSPTHGNMLIYLPQLPADARLRQIFDNVFSPLGDTVWPRNIPRLR